MVCVRGIGEADWEISVSELRDVRGAREGYRWGRLRDISQRAGTREAARGGVSLSSLRL